MACLWNPYHKMKWYLSVGGQSSQLEFGAFKNFKPITGLGIMKPKWIFDCQFVKFIGGEAQFCLW